MEPIKITDRLENLEVSMSLLWREIQEIKEKLDNVR